MSEYDNTDIDQIDQMQDVINELSTQLRSLRAVYHNDESVMMIKLYQSLIKSTKHYLDDIYNKLYTNIEVKVRSESDG